VLTRGLLLDTHDADKELLSSLSWVALSGFGWDPRRLHERCWLTGIYCNNLRWKSPLAVW